MHILRYSKWKTLFEANDSPDPKAKTIISEEKLNQLPWFIALTRVLTSIDGVAAWSQENVDSKNFYVLRVSAGAHNSVLDYELKDTYRIDTSALDFKDFEYGDAVTRNYRKPVHYSVEPEKLRSPKDWNKWLFGVYLYSISHLLAGGKWMPERILPKLGKIIENKDVTKLIELFNTSNSYGNKLPNECLVAMLAPLIGAKELKGYRDLLQFGII